MEKSSPPSSPPGPTTSRLLAARHRIQRIISDGGGHRGRAWGYSSASSSEEEQGRSKRIEKKSQSTRKRAADQVDKWLAFDTEEELTESSSHRSKQTQCENDENASVNLVVEEKERRLSPSHRREDQMPKEQAMPEDIDAEVLVKVSDLVWIRGLLDAQRKALEVSKATNSILADGIHHVLTPYMKEGNSGSVESPVSACKLVRTLRKHMPST